MKEITRISLAALPFNIELQAKKDLETYLHAIEKTLSADADAMKEIESRVVELLDDQGVRGEKVITTTNIASVKEHLGEPADFASDDDTDATENAATHSEKHLMRDERGAMIGGVCAGLAAYFHIDSVWIRLVAALLIPFTAGFAFLLYIVLWIVMPPARSAAERLQMRGEAVTPSAIKRESVSMPEAARRQTLLFVMRIGAGAAALLLSVVTLLFTISVAYYLTQVWADQANLGRPIVWSYIAPFAVAGGLLVLFLLLAGYALLKPNASKRVLITLGVIAFAGMSSFVVGIWGQRTFIAESNRQLEEATITKQLPLDSLETAKQLVVDSDLPITVNYNVDATRREMVFHTFTTPKSKFVPEVQVNNSNGVLTISIPKKDTVCLPEVPKCRSQYTVTIVGPALDVVSVGAASHVMYNTEKQSQLVIASTGTGELELNSTGAIDVLEATASNEAMINVTGANIRSINLKVEDSLSNISIATVQALAITVPTSCAETSGHGKIRYAGAQTVTVNTRPYLPGQEFPCASIEIAE